MEKKKIIDWLLRGDVSIQYQTWRDLLDNDKIELRERIANEGWGLKYLTKRNPDGHWGYKFYQPKWTSTHYTLLDLRNLNLPSDNKIVYDTLEMVLKNNMAHDGGIRLGPSTAEFSDVCVNGMFLNYASYFKVDEKKLHSVVDIILHELMTDGGFNCMRIRGGAQHSSLHSTISVLEGLTEFLKAEYTYRKDKIQDAIESAIEFILIHQLFLSDKTGLIINKNFLKLTYPCRWKYDILRAIDFFQYAGIAWDDRMEAALNIIKKKRNDTGTWNAYTPHAGNVHFHMEKAAGPGRWNTLRVLRVLKKYGKE